MSQFPFVSPLYNPRYSWRWKIAWLLGCFLAGVWLSLNIPLIIPLPKGLIADFPPLAGRLLSRGFTGLIIGTALFFLSGWFASLSTRAKLRSSVTIPMVLQYAFLITAVWLVFFLAFFPGMMSADSLYQWKQVLTGHYTDQHPPFHTFTIWLITRIYLSPAAVALAQIIALALVAGACLGFMQSIGVPVWLLWINAAFFALSPVNGTMVNTLWKDVPFSTSVLWLTLLLAIIIWSDGKWLTKPANAVLLGAVSALVLLFRYDGFPIGAGVLLLVFIAYPKRWKGMLIATALCSVLYLGITGPLYRVVGVHPEPSHNNPQDVTESILSLYTLSLQSKPEESAILILKRIALVSGKCDHVTKLRPYIEKSLETSVPASQMITNAVNNLPIVLLFDYRCRRSMEWIVYDPQRDVYNPSHAEYWIDPNPYGITPSSKIPAMQKWVSAWVSRTAHNPKLSWLVWRPALYLYIHLFVVAVAVLRTSKLQAFLLAAPVLIQSILFSLIPLAPNFRLHYSVYLTGLIFWPLLFFSVRQGNTAELNTQRI